MMAVLPVKIYVGNLPPSIESHQIQELFADFGEVKVEFTKSRICAFVTLERQEDTDNACAALNEKELLGSKLRVERATGRRDPQDKNICFVCQKRGHRSADCPYYHHYSRRSYRYRRSPPPYRRDEYYRESYYRRHERSPPPPPHDDYYYRRERSPSGAYHRGYSPRSSRYRDYPSHEHSRRRSEYKRSSQQDYSPPMSQSRSSSPVRK